MYFNAAAGRLMNSEHARHIWTKKESLDEIIHPSHGFQHAYAISDILLIIKRMKMVSIICQCLHVDKNYYST